MRCCWSSTYPLTKIGLGSIPPVTFISARSLIAAFFLLAILYARGLRIPTDAKAWKLFAFQQTINSTIPFLMITWAQQYVPAAPTVVLASTTPIFAFLITWGITRHEPATLLKLAGACAGSRRNRRDHRPRRAGGSQCRYLRRDGHPAGHHLLCLRHDLRAAADRVRSDGGGGRL